MINLFLHILCTVSLFLIFRYFKRYNVNSFHSVAINYFVCIAIGLIFLPEKSLSVTHLSDQNWIGLALFTGSLFVPAFYLMGLTVEKVSVSVATVANKMSLIIPVVISLIYLRKGPDNFSHLNYTGIFFALIAIILTSYRKAEQKNENRKYLFFLLPFSIFFLGGLIDTLINYTNYAFLQGKHPFLFPLVMFTIAAATGIIILAIKLISKREIPRLKDVAGGFALGIPNYFSLYFLLRTLSDFKNDGAVVFPVVNIGIIVVASLAAVLIFKEKLSGLNLIGICLSAVSIILIFW